MSDEALPFQDTTENTAFRTMIVPLAWRKDAYDMARALAPASTESMFIVRLSPTGFLPVTHYISTGYISELFGKAVLDPVFMHSLCVAIDYPCTQEHCNMLSAACDTTEDDPFAALARLGLQIIQSDAESIVGITAGVIDTNSNVQGPAIVTPAASYNVSVNGGNDGGSGIRFKIPLNQLVPNAQYICTFNLSASNPAGQSICADVCDDSDRGPFPQGRVLFRFSRASYDNAYRFIDIWVAEEYEAGFFTVSAFQVFKEQ